MRDVVLRLEGVGQGFRRGRDRWRVFGGVDLSVAEGEFVGVLGGRGEGKTTLLELAAGLRLAEAGSVWFEAQDLARCSEDERTALLGDRIVWMPRADFADYLALEYVALPVSMRGGGMAAAEERAMAALQRVGAEGCARAKWEELSDWDRLMVTFARGFAARPRLMVVDDLLDGLGASGVRQASELLLGFARELRCGVLASASHIGALMAADRVFCFDGEGSITEATDPPNHTTNLYRLDDARRRRGQESSVA